MSAFTAIDVETANADLASICQIGIVRFDDGGVIVDEWSSLVNPEDDFDAMNVSIHGITEEDVAGAPTLPALHPILASRLCDRLLVSHTAFDRVSLTRAAARYELAMPGMRWLDSARVARRAWPEQCGKRGYSMHHLREMLALTFTEHVAVEDAKAAGWVLLRAMTDTGIGIPDWLDKVNAPLFGRVTQDGNPEGALDGESIVFTGALEMVRSLAAKLAADAGCDVSEGVNKKTTLLVVGDQDIKKLAGHMKSSKHRKAESLILAGQTLRILSESDFRTLLALNTAAES